MSTEENVPLTEPDERYKYVARGNTSYWRNNDRSGLLLILQILTFVAIGVLCYVVTQALLESRVLWIHDTSVSLPPAIVMAMAILGMLLLFVTSVITVVFLGLLVWCIIIVLRPAAIDLNGIKLLGKLFAYSIMSAATTTAYLALFYWL